MILSLQAFAPAALLLAGGLLLLLRPSATIYVVVQVAALVALLRLSQLATAALTIPIYEPLTDIPLQFRVDRLSLFFATTAVAAALLLSIPWVGERGRDIPFGWLALAQFGGVCAILSGNLQGLAAGWGAALAALLMLVIMPHPGARELSRPARVVTSNLVLQLAGAVLLLVGAVAVEATAGTASYDAIPVGALDARTSLLVTAAPLIALASLAALVRACRRPAAAAVMVTAVMLPMSTYVLARTYDLAGGRPLPNTGAMVLVGIAGLLAAMIAVHAIWAPDLGAAVSRLLSALGLLLIAAFGLGGAAGLVALLGGFISLEVVGGAMLVILEAGSGRLPGGRNTSRWAAGILALVPLAALAGLAVGFALDARLLLFRGLVELGPIGALVGAPVLAAVLAIAAAAWASARFGGGDLRGRRGVVQAVLAIAALVSAELAAPLLRDTSVAIAAAASRVPVADVRSGAGAALPATPVALVVVILVLAAVGLVAARPRSFSTTDGLRLAPDMLPPKMAVVPGIVLRRLTWAISQHVVAVARGTGRGTRVALLTLAWLVATLLILLAGR
jgi:hypothetical protein